MVKNSSLFKKEIAKLLPDKSLARDRENMKLLRRLNTCVSKKANKQ